MGRKAALLSAAFLVAGACVSQALAYVEAPDVGSPRWNMSEYRACEVALHSEKKAFEFYDRALESVQDPQVRALFVELREEEAGHVRLIEAVIAKLPPSARVEAEDQDDSYMRMGY